MSTHNPDDNGDRCKKRKMKLKTLKDLKWKTYNSCECGNYNEGCLSCYNKDIKKEAIKWVKDRCPEEKTKGEECDHCKGAVNIFKTFFNITEEDLNSKKLKGGKETNGN